MPIKIMEADASPGKSPKNIGKKDVSVYQTLGKKCYELLKFKTSLESVYFMIPQMNDGTHISFHQKEIHIKINNDCKNVDISSFFEANKLFTRSISPCLCIRIGYKIKDKDLEKIMPILVKFLPRSNINESSLKNQLLKNIFHINHILAMRILRIKLTAI